MLQSRLGRALVILAVTALRANAGLTAAFLQFHEHHSQTSSTQVVSDGYSMSINVYTQAAGDFANGTLVTCGGGTGCPLTLSGSSNQFWGSVGATDLASLANKFPFGSYAFTLSNPGSASTTVDYTQNLFSAAVPSLTATTYNALQELDTTRGIDINFNPFIDQKGQFSGVSLIFFGPRGEVHEYDPGNTTSIFVPANTLHPNSNYRWILTFINSGARYDSNNVADGLTFYTETEGTFTTGIAVKMFDSHRLQVDVTAQFSQIATTPKSITVNTTINGVPLQSILPLASATGTQKKSLFIDFDGLVKVPRFIDNQVFDVTATATENGAVVSSATKTGNEIPLPVVHVHGILTDCLPDRIPHGLFDYLKGVHPSYTEDDGFPVLTHTYPTLVSFDYPSLSGDPLDSGSQLTSWIQTQLLPRTYASKVEVVAHSLGGIVTRAAIANFGGGTLISKLVLVGSPSEGATLAPIALNNWGAIQGIVAALRLTPVAFVPSISSALSCLMGGLPFTSTAAQRTSAELLRPTYGWFASTRDAAQQGLLQVPISSANISLANLNNTVFQGNIGLDPRVEYYAVVASGVNTATKVWGRFWIAPLPPFPGGSTPAALFDSLAYGPGDGIVPIGSQKGATTGWPVGIGPGKLYIFADVGAVAHTEYFGQLQVQIDVDTALWP